MKTKNITIVHETVQPYIYKPMKPRVLIPANVYAQMLTLVHNYTTEIGWCGMVNKLSDTTYVIEKIMVYPQKVTGVTVQDDHDAYAAWIGQQSLDDLPRIRLYAHSHVNMGVNPSGVDLQQFDTYKAQVDDFYIMMIMNKKNEMRLDIYDKKKDTLHVGCEFILSYDADEAILKEAEQHVKKQVVHYNQPRYGYPQNTYPGSYGWYDEPEVEEPYFIDKKPKPDPNDYYTNRAAHKAKKFANKYYGGKK